MTGETKIGIDATDVELQAVDAALRIQWPRRQRGIGKSERLIVRSAQTEDRGRILAAVERWEDVARRIAAILLLEVGEGRPVVEETRATL